MTHQTTVLHGPTDIIEDFAFSPNDQLVATADAASAARLWDTATGNPVHTFSTVTNSVRVAFSQDGSKLAIGSDDGTVHLFDPATGNELATFTGHRMMVTALAFSPDGTMLASGSRDATVRLWDVPARTALRTLTGFTDYIDCLAFSPDETVLLAADGGGVLHRRQVSSGLEGTHRPLFGVPRAISADGGTLLVEGGADHRAHVWELNQDTEVASLPGFERGTAALSTDGRALAMIGYTGTAESPLQLWRLRP
ncbi:hypothetical protein [Kitasatospora cystarginea]|uniref:WD40 repeat domain-containing protein n=1 Tax=Kitasatospora cystarginea TaxID=58350 RepID=UPI0031DDD6DE